VKLGAAQHEMRAIIQQPQYFGCMPPYADSCPVTNSSEMIKSFKNEMIKLFKKSNNFEKLLSEIEASSAQNATTTESYNPVQSVFWLYDALP
jgi:hypothetical protein